jgi:hypothetical protein
MYLKKHPRKKKDKNLESLMELVALPADGFRSRQIFAGFPVARRAVSADPTAAGPSRLSRT